MGRIPGTSNPADSPTKTALKGNAALNSVMMINKFAKILEGWEKTHETTKMARTRLNYGTPRKKKDLGVYIYQQTSSKTFERQKQSETVDDNKTTKYTIPHIHV